MYLKSKNKTGEINLNRISYSTCVLAPQGYYNKAHKLGCLDNRNVLSHSCGGEV